MDAPENSEATMFDGKISRQMLKTNSGEFDIESIHTLLLREKDISDLGCIGECVGLDRLNLSKNDITKLYALAGLTQLAYLDLSANRIQALDGLQSLDNLKHLNLAGNLIGSVDALRCLSGLEKLTDLRLKDPLRDFTNPVCMSETYKADVKAILPKLINLDGERLAGKGSDVFKMLEDLEKILPARNNNQVALETSGPESWVTADYWKPSLEFENSSLGDADKQLQELLAECRRVTNEADEKIKQSQTKRLNNGAS